MSIESDFELGCMCGDPGTAIELEVTDTSASTTNALSTGVVYMIASTIPCRFIFGATPTALATSSFLPANTIIFVRLSSDKKMAAIREGGTSGKLTITPMTGYGR